MDLSGAKVNAAALDPRWDVEGRLMCASLHELSGWAITRRQAVKAASGAIKLMETRVWRKSWKWIYYLYSGRSTERAALSPQTNCCWGEAEGENLSLGSAKPELSAFTGWLWVEMCPCGNGPVVLFDFLPSRCLEICKSSQAFSVSSSLVAKVLQGKMGFYLHFQGFPEI